jgi:hypothetical protein
MARIPPRPTSGPVCITRYSAAQPQGGRSNVTLVTDATAAFGSDGMKTTTSNDVHRCRRSIDVAAPHSERLSAPSPSRFPTDQSRDAQSTTRAARSAALSATQMGMKLPPK